MSQTSKTISNTDVLRVKNDIYNPDTNMLNIQKDAVACYIFGSKNNDDIILLLLDALISDKIDGQQLKSIMRIECTKDGTGLLSKETKFDFYGVTNLGNPVVIEVQCYDDGDFITRILLYLSRAFSSQFRYCQDKAAGEEQDQEQSKFFDFAKTFVIALTNKQIVQDVDLAIENYRLYGDATKKLLSDKLNVTIANFGGFNKKPEDCESKLDYVLSFMKDSYSMDNATLNMMCERSEFYRAARRAFNWALLSEMEQTAMIGYQMKRESEKKAEFRAGKKVGLKEAAKRMIALGMDDDTISKCLDLPPEDLAILRKEV